MIFLENLAINSRHIIIVYLSIVAIYIAFLLCKKAYYNIFHNRQYIIIPRLQIKSISNISMVIAMNIALIITISLLTNNVASLFFKIYPGARFLIENLLIKIGGIFFGPIIGIFIGFITDLLTVMLTSSVLNYGYFLSAIINGFMGGIIHLLIKHRDPRKIFPTLASIVMAILATIYFGILIYNNNDSKGTFKISILSLSLDIHYSIILTGIILLFLIITAFLLASMFAFQRVNDPRYDHIPWIKKYAEKYDFFLILMMNYTIYMVVDIVSLPLFDIKLSSLPYEQFLISRIITSIPALLIFSRMIAYIYRLNNAIQNSQILKSDIPESGLMPWPVRQKREVPRISQ